MVTIKDVAAQSETSYATVSRFINNNGYVSEDARQRIQKTIEKLNYQPNSIARSLVMNKSHVIGILVPYIDSPFFSSFVEGIESEAMKQGYNIFLCHSHENDLIEQKYLKLLKERRVDGIIVTPVGLTNDHFLELSPSMPIVFAVRSFDDNRISSISVDNTENSARVIRYLIAKGHKNIGIINGNLEINTAKQRWMGVEKAFSESGLDINKNLVCEEDYRIDGGYHGTQILLNSNEPITAIYAANNLLSAGCLKALLEKGYRVPDDISLAAFDGFDSSYASEIICRPYITANIFPSRAIGEEAVKMLREEMEDRKEHKAFQYKPKHKVFEMSFLERESVKQL